jgi:predicted HicB family RNase H-like nuclease
MYSGEKAMYVRLPKDLYLQIQTEALNQGTSLKDLITSLIREYLNRVPPPYDPTKDPNLIP